MIKGFIKPLNDSHPNAAGEAFFAAVVDPPECPIKWMHNDQEIAENDRRKFGRDGGFCTMKILGCTNDDLGTYAIEVQNEADGNPKSLARLVNPVQAKFLQPIVGGDAVIGSEFILECQVEPESVEVEWYRNSQRLGGDPKNAGGDFKIVANKNTRQLVLNQFNSEQAGTYFVKIVQSAELIANEPIRIANVNVAQVAVKAQYGLNPVACKEGGTAKFNCLLEEASSDVTWYKALKTDTGFDVQLLESDERIKITTQNNNVEHTLELKNVQGDDEGIYVIKVKTDAANKSLVYSCDLTVTNKAQKPKGIIKSSRPQFISTVNQVIAAPGSVAEFSCEVEPHNTEVCWYNGSNTLKNGDKYQIISQGHKRILRVNNCNEELDNGQFIVQIKSKEAHQRIQIAHLRVGAPTPQDLLAKWAEEMQRCQSIMSEMASCQRIFEQKAIDAEEKLRKWRKKNPLKGDGKSGYDGQGKKKSGGSGADSDSYSDEEQSEKARSEKDIKNAAAAAVRRSGVGTDRKSQGGSSRSKSVPGRKSAADEIPRGRHSIKDRASMFSNASSDDGGPRRSRSVCRPFKKPTINETVAKQAAAALGALELPDDMPPAERKLKELEYQLALKDLINSGLQEELTRIQNSLNKAVGQVSAWQYDRRGMDFQPATSNEL